MPNHMHGILELLDVQIQTSLPQVIRAYKAVTSHDVRRLPDKPWFAWQPSFYERIVRNEEELDTYRNYILNNPAKWEQDRLYHRH